MSESDSEWKVTTSRKQQKDQSQVLSQRSVQYHQQKQQNRRVVKKHQHVHHGEKHQHLHHHVERQSEKIVEKQDQTETESVDSNVVQKPQKEVKSISEYGWTDIKQLRRLIVHLETIANYSKGGVIGSLRGNTIHNSEDREKQIRPISELKITEQENAFLKHLATFCDNQFGDIEEIDTLLGFLHILHASITQLRFANEEINNFAAYNEKLQIQIWKSSSVPSSLEDTLKKELQQKYDESPLSIDSSKLQDLLIGKSFKFEYKGNLTLPFCLDSLHQLTNAQESVVIKQRRSLYMNERSATGAISRYTERSVWRNSTNVTKAREYKSQIETFEAQYLEGVGIPVLGVTNLASLLQSICTSFLKIRKEQTPNDLIQNLKTLLKTLPNLIFLPEILQKVNGTKWIASADLPDYEEIKNKLKKYLEKEGIQKTNETQDQIRITLHSIYNFNKTEIEKYNTYLEHIKEIEEDSHYEKGYPLNPQIVIAILKQLNLDAKKYKNEIDLISTFPELDQLASQL